MSETSKEVDVKDASDDKWSTDNPWIIIVLILLFGFGCNSPENPKISELEKKVARLEGQMSMIGGRKYE